MSNTDGHKNRLHWTPQWFGPDPRWVLEPDIAVVRKIAKTHLINELPPTFDDALLDVSFFTEGGFNKLYSISYPGHDTSYLLRVALPVIPYYKTESEVATIEYLHANTTIPVPQIFAWDSNQDNELSFEWILMEKMRGVPLIDLWPQKVDWKRKQELTQTVTRMMNQLRECKFNRIGALYFTSALNENMKKSASSPRDSALDENFQACDEKNAAVTMAVTSAFKNLYLGYSQISDWLQDWFTPLYDFRGTEEEHAAEGEVIGSVEDKKQSNFSIGPIFARSFYEGSRPSLFANRGPYENSFEWLDAEIRIQLERIKNPPVEDDVEYDDDFNKESPNMERMCREFLDILPSIIGNDESGASYHLYHGDLNAGNILVDPETMEVTGIVDWEKINVVPTWRTTDAPKYLDDEEPTTDEEPPLPQFEEDEDSNGWWERNRWEHMTLRRLFTEIIREGAQEEGETVRDPLEANTKLDFYEYFPMLTHVYRWERVEEWLQSYREGKLCEEPSNKDRGVEERGG